MLSLVLATALFAGIHLLVSGTRRRDGLVSALGERAYQGLFSLVSAGALTWMVIAYRNAPTLLWWGPWTGLWPLALVLTAVAFLLVVVGLTTPNPTSVGAEGLLGSPDAVTGILRVTRHPFLCGVALWAATHLAINGTGAETVLFGGVLLVALAGPASIDAKRARHFGDRWDAFAASTSILPFAAIASGRNRFAIGELGGWRPLAAVVVWVAVLLAHRWAFGVPAIPV